MHSVRSRASWAILALLSSLALSGCSSSPMGPGSNGVAQPEFVRVGGTPKGAFGSQPVDAPVTITTKFNGTAIPAGSTIWFSAAFKYAGPTSAPVTLNFDGSTIQYTVNGATQTLSAPGAIVTFQPGAGAVT